MRSRFLLGMCGVAMLPAGMTSTLARAALRRDATRCAPSHTRTVAIDTKAIVFLTPVKEPLPALEYRGCVFGNTKTVPLGGPPERHACSSSFCGGTRSIVLAGDMVALEYFEGGVGGDAGFSRFRVEVIDLASGRKVHDAPTGTLSPAEKNDEGIGAVASIVVKSDGATAWVAEDDARYQAGQPGYFEIFALDRGGERQLSASDEIEPKSLAVGGNTVYWTQGGIPHSAPLH